jgi:hypothetical protein
VHAGSAWYVGPVKRVALLGSDGSFVVTVENDVLSDCNYQYAYFDVAKLGIERVNKAYTMALTSLSTGYNMGIVIDKDINGPGGDCYAKGMTADLRK